MAFEAIEQLIEEHGHEQILKDELAAARELLEAVKQEYPAAVGRTGRAVRRCETIAEWWATHSKRDGI